MASTLFERVRQMTRARSRLWETDSLLVRAGGVLAAANARALPAGRVSVRLRRRALVAFVALGVIRCKGGPSVLVR